MKPGTTIVEILSIERAVALISTAVATDLELEGNWNVKTIIAHEPGAEPGTINLTTVQVELTYQGPAPKTDSAIDDVVTSILGTENHPAPPVGEPIGPAAPDGDPVL